MELSELTFFIYPPFYIYYNILLKYIYLFDFFSGILCNPKWNIPSYTGKSLYVFIIEELQSLSRHQYYILWIVQSEKPCSSSPFPSLSPVAADSHPEAQEGASISEPLRRSDRTGSGREGSLLPRLQSSSSRHPSGEWRPVETSMEDLTFEPNPLIQRTP